jgi:hypothetical protein
VKGSNESIGSVDKRGRRIRVAGTGSSVKDVLRLIRQGSTETPQIARRALH